MNSKSVLLISFHNQKALGVRYLESSLNSKGHAASIVFFKAFNSEKPTLPSQIELALLKNVINETKPDLIGLSVMSSLYLETVYAVNNIIRDNYNIPTVWGGVFATLFPERCLEHADFVIRGEGENAIVDLVEALSDNSYESIENLAYKKDDKVIINGMRALCQNIDEYGYPQIGGNNKYLINNGILTVEDPQLRSINYELTASRGCPFVCSYCCSVNLHRIYAGKGSFVRFRSVQSVIDELKEAKKMLSNLKVVHFWDEIFSDDPSWIDEFVKKYRDEINLPFEIWGHPLKTDRVLISKLVSAGLYKVVMGIQSGSPRVRKNIFHRVEKQDQIIEASRVLKDSRVPQVIYDFMLRHPFESEDDIKETYELCMQLIPSFELQLHGLNFLPGTDIAEMAIEQKLFTKEELDKIMFSPMHEQYNAYWGYENRSTLTNFWYSLTFMSQFRILKPITKILAKRHNSRVVIRITSIIYKLSIPLKRLNYYIKKGGIILRALKSPVIQ